MAEHEGAERPLHGADRDALVEATTETLEVYANLAERYRQTIARQAELLRTAEDTLQKVRRLLSGNSSAGGAAS